MVQVPKNVPDSMRTRLNNFLKDNNVQMSEDEQKQLNTIFDSCDVIDNSKGKDPLNIRTGQDGELNANERQMFLDDIKSKMSKLYDKVKEFFDNLDKKTKTNKQKKQDVAYTKRKKYPWESLRETKDPRNDVKVTGEDPRFAGGKASPDPRFEDKSAAEIAEEAKQDMRSGDIYKP